MIISNVSEESCDIVFSCWNHLPPPFKWCKCNNSKGTGLVVLKFGVYIDRERAMSWVTFQGPGWKVKVTASEKVMILVNLVIQGLFVTVMGSTRQFSLESKQCHDPNFVIAAGHDASFFITGTTFWSLVALQVVITTTCSAISDQKLASWKLSVSSAWYILYIWCFNSKQLYQEYVPSLLVFFCF